MAQITLTYDARNAIARKTLDYILSLGFFKVEQTEKPRYNAETEKAIASVRAGKDLIKAKNVDDLFKKLKN